MDSLLDIEFFRSIWGIAVAILFFGGTIFVHELGHFLAAKKRGLKVERFSIGFGPRIWGWTGKDGVDYRLSLFPLGGYVALPQMADMSAVEGAVDDDAEKLPKIGYADKMIVAIMGATFNVLFACLLACVLWIIGMPERPGTDLPIIGGFEAELTNAKGEKVPAPAYKSGLSIGDKVVSVDGRSISSFSDFITTMTFGSGRDTDGRPMVTLVVERDGKTLEPIVLHPVPSDSDGSGDTRRMIGVRNAVMLSVDISKDPASVAAKAGLKNGDRIVSVNGLRIWDIEQFRDAIALIHDSAQFTIERQVDGKPVEMTMPVTPEPRPVRVATLLLDFPEGEAKRTIELVPSPANPRLSEKALEAPRPALMVCDTPAAEPPLATTLPVGTVVYGISGNGGVRQNLSDLEAVRKLVETSGGDVTLYLRDENKDSNLVLKGVTARVKDAEMKKTVDGVAPRSEPGKPIHRAPWYYLNETFATTMRTLKALFTPGSDVGVKHLTGVIGIARIYYNFSESIRGLLWFTILINVNLAIFNVLPLPVLDGGHMVYATIEKLRGKPLPLRIVEGLQLAFVVILFTLMAFILWRDIYRWRVEAPDTRNLFAKALLVPRETAAAKK